MTHTKIKKEKYKDKNRRELSRIEKLAVLIAHT